jgi:hypothetical protein
MEALETGAADLRRMSTGPAHVVRSRIEQTVDEVLQHLEADADDPEPEDVMSRLDRQSREIAEDLRRVEQLMKRRTGME